MNFNEVLIKENPLTYRLEVENFSRAVFEMGMSCDCCLFSSFQTMKNEVEDSSMLKDILILGLCS